MKMKLKLKRIIQTVLMVCSFSVIALGGESTSPIFPVVQEVDVTKKSGTTEFSIYNTSNELKVFEVSVNDLDNQGNPSLIAPYIKLFPKKISVPAGENARIRVRISGLPEEMLGKGEYRGGIHISGLSSDIENKYESKDGKKGLVSTQVKIKLEINTAVYAYSGNEKAGIEQPILVKNTNKKDRKPEVVIANTGNYSYPLYVVSYDDKGQLQETSVTHKLVVGQKVVVPLNKIDGIKYIEVKQEKNNVLLGKYNLEDLKTQ